MLPFDVAQDIYRHLKGDDGLMPAGVSGDWLDSDHRPLWQLLDAQPAQFHLHCVHTPQQYEIQKHLPLIWFSTEATADKNYPANDAFALRVAFRVYADDPSGVTLNGIAHRISCLLDRHKDGTRLWNACPLRARYLPFTLQSVSPVEPCSFAQRLYRVVLVFTGKALAQTNLRGIPHSQT